MRVFHERSILTLQWLARRGTVWGDSHTRYVTPDGTLRRSFVHYFSPRRLRAELSEAGFRMEAWTGGHVELSRASG